MTDKLTAAEQYHKALHAMPSAIKFNASVAYKTTSFKYVDFKALRAAVLPILAEHDLSARYTTKEFNETLLITGEIVHLSGEVVNSFGLPLRPVGKPQDLGSEITYYKRYALAALCGVVGDQDDDGNFADKAEAAREHAKPKGSHKLDTNMRPALAAILSSTSLEELEQVKKDFEAPIKAIYKEWPSYMSETSGEQTKSFTDQIDEHKARLQSDADIEKQQREDTEFKNDF